MTHEAISLAICTYVVHMHVHACHGVMSIHHHTLLDPHIQCSNPDNTSPGLWKCLIDVLLCVVMVDVLLCVVMHTVDCRGLASGSTTAQTTISSQCACGHLLLLLLLLLPKDLPRLAISHQTQDQAQEDTTGPPHGAKDGGGSTSPVGGSTSPVEGGGSTSPVSTVEGGA